MNIIDIGLIASGSIEAYNLLFYKGKDKEKRDLVFILIFFFFLILKLI